MYIYMHIKLTLHVTYLFLTYQTLKATPFATANILKTNFTKTSDTLNMLIEKLHPLKHTHICIYTYMYFIYSIWKCD